MKEALAGGPKVLDARDEGIADTAKVIEDAFKARAQEHHAPRPCPSPPCWERSTECSPRGCGAANAPSAAWMRSCARGSRATGRGPRTIVGASLKPLPPPARSRICHPLRCTPRRRSDLAAPASPRRRWPKTTGRGSCSPPPRSSRNTATRWRQSRRSPAWRASTAARSIASSPTSRRRSARSTSSASSI